MIVKMFSFPFCPYCEALKDFLKKYRIEFREVDLDKNPEAKKEMIKKSGQRGVPVLEIDDQIVIGFDRKRVCELLNIKE